MTTPHTPPTQAELDEWKLRFFSIKTVDRLIAEVERLWALVNSMAVPPHYGSALENELERLTKEVEELRKDKERLDACLLGKKIRIQVHERYCTFSHEHKWKELLSREQIDAAMQQKGEE